MCPNDIVRISHGAELRSTMQIIFAFGFAAMTSSNCLSNAFQSYCPSPRQNTGYWQYGSPSEFVVLEGMIVIVFTPTPPKFFIASNSAKNERYAKNLSFTSPKSVVAETAARGDEREFFEIYISHFLMYVCVVVEANSFGVLSVFARLLLKNRFFVARAKKIFS